MNQHNELSDDIEGVRISLFQSACCAIWHYYRITTTLRNNVRSVGYRVNIIPDQRDMKYPATLAQLMEFIEPLLRLPIVDLLSMKMNLSNMTELFGGFTKIFMIDLNEMCIFHWAIFLGLTEVVELIIDIDSGLARNHLFTKNYYFTEKCLPVHMILNNLKIQVNLRIIEKLYNAYPASLSTPDFRGNLPLHTAVKQDRPLTIIQFLMDKFPEAVRTKNESGLYPLNMCTLNGKSYCEETERLLIEAFPKALATVYDTGDSTDIYYHCLFRNPEIPPDYQVLKMSYALGKKYNVFQLSEVHGLFTTAHFSYIYFVPNHIDTEDDELYDAWMDMWRDTFHDRDPVNDTVRRTTLELFLCTYRNLNGANYIHGWEEAMDVFQIAMDTTLLQSAISRVQDNFLPYMIDKFDIDLLRPDEHGRTPLIVSIYHTVFVELDDSKNTDDEFDSDMDDSDMDDSDMDDSDMDDSDRNIDDDKDEDEVKGLSKRLSDASMVLSCGDATYKRRDDQSLKCDVIGMMIENKEQRPTKSARTTMNITTNSNHDRAKVNAAMIRDDNGRLPLHVGAAIGLKWQNGLKTVLEAYKPAVKEADPMSGLYAFMLAATVKVGGDLTAVFSLFVEQPDVLEQIS